MAGDMSGELKNRGKRKGSAKGAVGTHDAWTDPADRLVQAFLNGTDAEEVAFPQLIKKIVKLAQALWRSLMETT